MTDDNKKLTQIGEIGKYGLIERLTKNIRIKNNSSVYGIGDDAAVIDHARENIVTSVKVLNEGIHFSLVYFPFKHLGYKAVVSAISNIYAMNARPKQILLGISLTNRFSVEAVEAIYEGVKTACDTYGLDLVGGDTTSAMSGLSLSVTAIGSVRKEHLVYRHGAKPNDLICVSGNLGAAYLGLQLLERERAIFEENKEVQPDLTGHEYILSRQLKPEIRVEVIDKLQELALLPTSMIDITDGLASDLLHLCEQSNTGCKLMQENIPIDDETRDAAEEFHMEPTTCALNGGDDFEFLFTVPLDSYETVKNIAGISIIGHVTPRDDGRKLITVNNEAVTLTAPGWGSQE